MLKLLSSDGGASENPHITDALVMSDIATGRIVGWNEAAERLFGYTAVEAIGQPIEMLVHTSVAGLYQERYSQYMVTGSVDVLTGREPLMVVAMAKGGAQLQVMVSIASAEVPGTPTRHDVLMFREPTGS